VRNAWNTVLNARENHTQARNRERSDGERGIVDTDKPIRTTQMFVNELVSVLFTCHSDMHLYRATSVIEMADIMEYFKNVAPSWIFDRTRYIQAGTHLEKGIGGVEKWLSQNNCPILRNT
jgi:hypothetical protein